MAAFSGAVLIQQDAYYRNQPPVSFEARTLVNYDHPDSLETDRLVTHLEALKAGRAIEQPGYDFKAHLRSLETRRVEPACVLVIEGILVLADPELRRQLDLKVFVDTAVDLRLARRLRSDIEERGRTPLSVLEQYLTTVRPMHTKFVEPSRRYAISSSPRAIAGSRRRSAP